jgi:hypothetical protein
MYIHQCIYILALCQGQVAIIGILMSAGLLERPIRKGRSKRVTMATRRGLLSPRAAAILVDEFDAGQLQGAPNRQVVSSRRLKLLGLERIVLASFRKIALALTERPSSVYAFIPIDWQIKRAPGAAKRGRRARIKSPNREFAPRQRRAAHTDPSPPAAMRNRRGCPRTGTPHTRMVVLRNEANSWAPHVLTAESHMYG